MADPVRREIREGVMVVTIDNPPVNALSHPVRLGLAEALAAADAPEVTALVIAAAGRTFPAGADIREFGAPVASPGLPELCDAIEACAKPVVAALHGTALGGGFELALACHTRIALPAAKVGFPEIHLGLLPGAGGTQRAPRLCGAAEALKLMLDGTPIEAPTAMAMGLIDGVVEDDLLAQAVALAALLGAEARAGKPPVATRDRREGLRDPTAYEDAIRAARAVKRDERLIAPGKIIDCVEAALLLPFEAGLAFERAAFEDCHDSKVSAGLRHAFLAERRAAHIPEAGLRPPELTQIGVVGGGELGAGLVGLLLGAGYEVTLIEADRDALARSLSRIDDAHERAVAAGRLTAETREDEWGRLGGSTDINALGRAGLVIEAVPEDEALKAGVVRSLDRVLPPGALLASASAATELDSLARVTGRPAGVLGLQFAQPLVAQSLGEARLVEVIKGTATAPEAIAAGFALARRLGKLAVRASGGGIGDRLLGAYRTAADFLLEAGATPWQIDRAMREFGFALGPYQGLDLEGLDIALARRERQATAGVPAVGGAAIGDRLCEAGRFGRKAGAGYYRYVADSPEGEEDPAVLDIASAERAAKGIVARRLSSVEIRNRCLAAMVNEGARLLVEGRALRPSDIDVVAMLGFGYPRFRGGPMKTADMLSLLTIRNDLRGWAEEEEFWTPAPIFDEMIKNGRHFDDMNAG